MSKRKGIEIATAENVEVKFDILKSEEVQSELRMLKDVFKASYGPTGRLNLIQNVNGGHVTVSSNSQKILNSMTSFSTPVTQLLLQAVKGHLSHYEDGGLFTGLLMLELIDASLSSTLPRHVSVQINEHALQMILSHLETPQNCTCKTTADIGNIQQMLSVMKSIFATKPATGIKPNEINTLSVLLLRGFLSCIPNADVAANRSVSLDNLRIHGCEGPSISETRLIQGVLVETRRFPGKYLIREDDFLIKVALFDCSLSGNVDDKWFDKAQTNVVNNIPNIEHSVLLIMKTMVDKLVENGVRLLACQKVIHPTLQRYMMEKGVYCIERLSINHIEAVKSITGATRLSTFHGNVDLKCFGSLAEIKQIDVHQKRFLNLVPHETSHAISTLLLCAPDETSLDELRLLCSSVLTALKLLVYHPYLLSGGGCLETHLATFLIQQSHNNELCTALGCTKGQYHEGLRSVASAFLQIARSIDHDGYDHHIDGETHHHWISHNMEQLKHCLCGFASTSPNTTWYRTEELLNCKTDDIVKSLTTIKEPTEREYKNAIFDIMSIKCNGIKTAFETTNILLRVKHFVKEFH